jgi:ferredoxin-NADP reductase
LRPQPSGGIIVNVSHPLTQPPARTTARVVALRPLSPTGYELTLERGGLAFRAGQLLTVHGPTLEDDRNYTICSGEHDAHLQILFREIPAGRMTPRLAALRTGDAIEISAPLGEFTVRDPERPLWFIATGTGVAPCRAYLRSQAARSITLVHGVRQAADLFYASEFAALPYHPCVSGEPSAHFHGRVTAFCAGIDLPAAADYYLCGANEMFYEMRDLLAARGVPRDRIFTEAYYYTHE